MNPDYRHAVAAMNPHDLAYEVNKLAQSVHDAICHTDLADAASQPASQVEHHGNQVHYRNVDTTLEDAASDLDAINIIIARAHLMPDKQSRLMLRALINDLADELHSRLHDTKRRHEHHLARARPPKDSSTR